MQLYGRGIRRRLAPMLNGDQRRIEMAYAMQFSLPGSPALRYGEEIGMGEDLSLDGREAVRTPMHWDATANAGFSSAPPDALFRPVTMTGKFGAKKINVRAQQQDPNSLLRWFENLIHHAAYRSRDRHRDLLGDQSTAAALCVGAPIRRASRIDLAAAQPGRYRGDD
jgi:glycosidase